MPADNLTDAAKLLAGPLHREAARGYTDAAIIGMSIGDYARRWADQALAHTSTLAARRCCQRIQQLLADYAQSDRSGRKRRADAALHLLAQLPGAASRPEASSSRADLDAPIAGDRKRPPAWIKRLAKLGIQTNRDLLYHFPRDYLPLRPIADLTDGERAAVLAEAGAREESIVREGRGPRLVRYALQVADETGRAWVTSFARVPRAGRRSIAISTSPLALNFPPGTRLLLEGSVRRAGRLIEIQYSGSEKVDGPPPFEPAALVPLYSLTDGVYQGQVRPIVRALVDSLPHDLPDPLPPSLRECHHLLPLRRALQVMHFPESLQQRDAAARRLAFGELLTLQLALAQRQRELQQPHSGISMPPQGDVGAALEQALPFSLTRAQQRAIAEIAADMASDRPMYRLLQGDVGSGKTVVAAAALMIAARNHYQGALMAPTELLADQHYLVLSRLLGALGLSVELLTGSLSRGQRERAREGIRAGRANVIVGTHALIQEGVDFDRLGLVIVDEQHRFGVRQRAELRTKGPRPDTLVMTATPIPRTLALTLYGDMDISLLDEMPPGRRPVITRWVPSRALSEAYAFVRQQIVEGRQAYIVCPLIQESEKLQAEAATRLAEELRRDVFPDLRVGLLHGAMPIADKDAAMEAFRARETDILTTTTVIEVGVDVPNATLMVIINAERFGLAQLHQLRGRVGRGGHESRCLLVSDRKHDPSAPLVSGADDSLSIARQRLEVMLEETDGFRIAEQDLLLRGPGEFYGTRQHGLPDLRLARMARDLGVLDEAREAALWLIEQDPRLLGPEHAPLRDEVSALRHRMDRAAG